MYWIDEMFCAPTECILHGDSSFMSKSIKCIILFLINSWWIRWSIFKVSVQFSHSVMSDSLWPHGLQHARPPCLSPTPGLYSNSCPLSQWCHPTISSSVIHFSQLQCFPASGSFQMSQFFASGGQTVGSFVFSISSSNEYSGLIFFRMDWLDLLAVQGTLKSLLLYHSSKASIFRCSAFFIVQISHPYMNTGKTIALTIHLCCQRLYFLISCLGWS